MQFDDLAKQLLVLESVKSKKPLNIVTLFSGMGAPELALDKLGIKYNVLLASEIDDIASQIYHGIHGSKVENFVPDVYKVVDYIDKNIDKFEGKKIDLLVAGFCCQAFSGSGKGYGFYSRRVYPVNLETGEQIKIDDKNKTATVHFKKHLKPEIVKKGVTEHDDIYEISDQNLINAFKGEKYVKISPDSDGKLSFETIKVIKKLNPNIVILENVSAFGNAKISRTEADEYSKSVLGEARKYWGSTSTKGKTGLANFKLDVPDKDDTALFGKYLAEMFHKMNYRFFPMYLDPTSYTNKTVGRRPRIYMIAIKNHIADSIGLSDSVTSKGTSYDEAMEFFDIKVPVNTNKKNLKNITDEQWAQINQEKEDYNTLLNQTFDDILSEKEGNYFTNNPEQIFITIKAKLNSAIIKFIRFLNSKNIDYTKLNQDEIKNILAKIKNIKKELSWRYDSVPAIINLTNKDKGELYRNFIGKILTDDILEKAASDQIEALYIGTLTEEDDSLENISEAIFNFTDSDTKENYSLSLEILKAIYEEFIKEYITKRDEHNYIPTILKSQPTPSTHGKLSAAKYFIVFKDDEIYCGYLSPQQQLKIMGMTNPNLYKQIAKAANKAYKGSKALTRDNTKEITARIGNSMNEFVLEKLFSRMQQVGIL